MEAVNLATKIEDMRTLLWVVFVMLSVGTALWGGKFFWWKVQKTAEKEDYMPKLVETLEHLAQQQGLVAGALDKLMNRLDMHEEREERFFSAIMNKLDDAPRKSRAVVRVMRGGDEK